MAIIINVDNTSTARKAGILAGDELISVNGMDIQDVLDYKFYTYDRMLELVLRRNNQILNLSISKKEGEDLGLDFESYLMDDARSCQNKCVFCFIDQLPKGMRESLYFKDDDARLSFLMGNYITMTNLSDREIRRIIDLKISPVNISIHTTNPKLRIKMLSNRFAGDGYEIMKRFARAGIEMNTQIVACPGWNDGEELRRTIVDLEKLYPQLHSVSVVPVGLTKHRDGLTELKPYDAETAEDTVNIVTEYSDMFTKKHRSRIFYCADELYLKGKLDIPTDEYYEDYPQLENGVGMLRLLYEEFTAALDELERTDYSGNCTIATGEAAAQFLQSLIDLLKVKCNNVKCEITAVRNDFLGHSIDVAGLVTGGDLIAQLKDAILGDKLLIPSSMLRSGESVFLDGVSVADVERELGIPVVQVSNSGYQLLDNIIKGGGVNEQAIGGNRRKAECRQIDAV